MILTSTEGLEIGDVLLVAVELTDKATGGDFWWKTFRVVVDHPVGSYVRVMTLKMHPDPEKDFRDIYIGELGDGGRRQIVELVPKDHWPQGVIAMHTKHIHTGHIKLT